jgi:DNA polymerase-3 subunit delta'
MSGYPSAGSDSSDPWSPVVGQDEAVRRLTAAVAAPVHAYMFLGPAGVGKRTAAGIFAGELLAAASPGSADRDRRLAARFEHPDLDVITPKGNIFLIDDSKELVRLASLAPVESSRKVVVAVRFHDTNDRAMPPLLKVVEDPPPSTIFVFLADELRPEHATIASRCTRVDFTTVPAETIEAALVAEDVDPALAGAAATAADGRIERARKLARDPNVETRRRAWRSIPDRLDGTGAAVAVLVAEVRDLIDDAMEPLRAIHAEELAELERREEQFGTRGSGRADLEKRHKQVERQFRTEEIRFGLATLAARYRDSIRADDPRTGPLDAVVRLQRSADALIRNPNEALLLQALLLDLPVAEVAI